MKVKHKQTLSIDDVKHIAKLANLNLTLAQEYSFLNQLSETINYINDLNELDTQDVVPTYQVTGKTNAWREDTITSSLSKDDALKNALKVHNGFFVAKILWN